MRSLILFPLYQIQFGAWGFKGACVLRDNDELHDEVLYSLCISTTGKKRLVECTHLTLFLAINYEGYTGIEQWLTQMIVYRYSLYQPLLSPRMSNIYYHQSVPYHQLRCLSTRYGSIVTTLRHSHCHTTHYTPCTADTIIPYHPSFSFPLEYSMKEMFW